MKGVVLDAADHSAAAPLSISFYNNTNLLEKNMEMKQ
jgi:hypothetical protein